MKVITLLLVALIIVLAMPANAVDITTSVTVVEGNVPPTINNVIYDINQLDKNISFEVSVTASDFNGVNDIDYVVATLFYENFATLYHNTPNPPIIQLDQNNLSRISVLDSYTGIFNGTLNHTNYKPGFYILKVEVFDKAGASDTEEIQVLEISGLKGDFNGDGMVNQFEIKYLARHYAYWSGYENIYSCEVSGDGNLNAWDITYLTRAIEGMTGYSL